MGIFNSFAAYSGGSANIYGFTNEAALQEEMDNLENMESAELSDDLMEACIEAAVANERNMNTLMMTIAQEEFSYFVENGVEMVYEEGEIKGFFEKIKKLLEAAWKKIKSIFEKVLEKISEWVSSDIKFVKKHKEKITKYASKVKLKDSYDTIEHSSGKYYSRIAAAANEVISIYLLQGKKDDSVDKIAGNVRHLAAGNTGEGTMDMDDYKKWLTKELGMDEKSTVTIDAATVIAELSQGNAARKEVKAGYNNVKHAIAGVKGQLKASETKAANIAKAEGKDDNSNYGTAIKVCNTVISLLETAQRIQLKAVSNTHSLCRKVAVKCVTLDNKKDDNKDDSTNESYLDYDFDAMLV